MKDILKEIDPRLLGQELQNARNQGEAIGGSLGLTRRKIELHKVLRRAHTHKLSLDSLFNELWRVTGSG